MRWPPDVFELRLDALFAELDAVAHAVPHLRAPLIVTARHPCEGGANNFSAAQRRQLLLRFLPCGAYLDVELRSVPSFARVLNAARAAGVRMIISVHDFGKTPSAVQFATHFREARRLRADILKIASRVEDGSDVSRLSDLFHHATKSLGMAAMGIGPLGAASRVLLARRARR